MDEASRWLRYVVPGAIFELSFISLLFFDKRFCDCYGDVFGVESIDSVAILVAATIPIGFLCSVAASDLAWGSRAGSSLLSRVIRQYDDGAIVEVDKTFDFVQRECESDSQARVANSARNDLILHLIEGRQGFAPAATRASELLNLYNGLLNAFVATCAGVIAGTTAVLVTSAALSSPEIDQSRVALWFTWFVLWGLVGWRLLEAHRRVVRLLEFYLRDLYSVVSGDQSIS